MGRKAAVTGGNSELAALLRLLDEAYERRAWHGPNLRGSLRGVTAAEASWQPGPARHSIREIVLHAAYWKYTVRRRLQGEKRGTFRLKGSNWFPRPDLPDTLAWRDDLRLLDEEHRALRRAAASLSPERLGQIPPGSRTSYAELVRGIALHDVYHAGQVQLLKRMARDPGRTRR